MTAIKPFIAFLLVSCVLSGTLVAAGCGGDDESASETTSTEATTEDWAGGFCSALATWRTDLQAAADSVSDLSSLSQDTVEQAADDAASATETLSETIRDLGRPDTSAGDEISAAGDDLAAALDSGRTDLESAVEGVSSVADLPAAVDDIGTALTELGTEVDSALQTIGDADASGRARDRLRERRLLRRAARLHRLVSRSSSGSGRPVQGCARFHGSRQPRR